MESTHFIRLQMSSLLSLLPSEAIQSIESDMIDDIVVSYVASILEDMEELDIGEFVSIMDAYLPGFAAIEQSALKAWVESVRSKRGEDPLPGEVSQESEPAVPAVKPKRGPRRRSGRTSESDVCSKTAGSTWSSVASVGSQRTVSESSGDNNQWPTLSSSVSSCADSTSDVAVPCESVNQSTHSVSDRPGLSRADLHDDQRADPRLELLIEMFPQLEVSALKESLHNSDGNVESAVIKLLEKEANETAPIAVNRKPTKDSNIVMKISDAQVRKTSRKSRRKSSRTNSESCASVDEAEVLSPSELKDHIINRYSFIPADSEDKFHAPKLQLDDEKKMVRYRNSQVVSTRGERYSEVKVAPSDEMKKTYINLKPARQYRFH